MADSPTEVEVQFDVEFSDVDVVVVPDIIQDGDTLILL